MPKRLMQMAFCLLLVILAVFPAQGQKPPPQNPAVTENDEQAEQAQPEPPKRVLNVAVTNGRLTVELVNVDFGTAIREVGGKAGFVVEGSGEVFSRKLDTKFADIEIERGVTRLLSLVNEKNYMVYYSPGGAISKINIFPSAGGASPSLMQPSRPQFPSRPRPPARPVQPQEPSTVVPRAIPSRPVPPSARPTAPPPTAAEPQVVPEEEFSEENISATPYVPPQPKRPSFIPKRN